jgi:hypothetical protein
MLPPLVRPLAICSTRFWTSSISNSTGMAIAVPHTVSGTRTSAYGLMEGADIYQVAKNCRTSVEMIENVLRVAYQEYAGCGCDKRSTAKTGEAIPLESRNRTPIRRRKRRRIPSRAWAAVGCLLKTAFFGLSECRLIQMPREFPASSERSADSDSRRLASEPVEP